MRGRRESCNEQGRGEGLEGFKGGWARGHLCEREGAKRLVGPRPEGPCELTGDELGAAVSEGSTRQGSVWSLGRRQCLEGSSRATQTHVGGKLLPAWPGEAA